MSTDSRKHLHPEFRKFIEKQPYVVTLDGLHLTVGKDVFPPDMGLCAQNLAKIAGRYRPQVALDMGCGTGYLALMLKRQGVPEVWASDIHRPAVACAKQNVQENAVGPVTVVESDMFEGIPKEVKFDFIVFNQPFGPGQEGQRVCGCGADGGYAICQRFLLEAPAHLREDAVILMAFSDREPPENSPDRVAQELGYPVVTVLHEHYNDSNNFIFEIRPCEV